MPQWKSHALSCIKPGIDYFNDKFGSDTEYPLNAFNASRLFSPSKVFEINPTASDTDSLKDIKIFNATHYSWPQRRITKIPSQSSRC